MTPKRLSPEELERALSFLEAQERAKWEPSDSKATACLRAHIAALEVDNAKLRENAAAEADEARALREAREQLEFAADRLYHDLELRICNAPSDSVPVFDGIADLHDAIGKARAAIAAAIGARRDEP